MADIEQWMQDARELVQQFFKLVDLPSMKITWGSKKKGSSTNDPFGRVSLENDRIVLQYTVEKDNIWLIDMVKGVLVSEFPDSLQDTWSGWNFATVIALVIIPSTKISDSKKNRYRKEWIEINKSLTHFYDRFDYERWYRILSMYPRVQVSELLYEFLHKYEPRDIPLESQFNNYMKKLSHHLSSQEEVDVLNIALKYQTISAHEVHAHMPQLSESTIYRLLGNLTFQLNQYYLPVMENYGLNGIFLLSSGEDHLAPLQEFPFYENYEHFADTPNVMIKFVLPINATESVICQVQSGTELMLRFPRLTNIEVNPSAYDPGSEEWRSMKHSTDVSDVVLIEPDVSGPPQEVSKDELLVLKAVIQSRTTDYRKLSLHHSQSRTKRIVRSLERKKLYEPKVLWTKPRSLDTILLVIPLSDWKIGYLSEKPDFRQKKPQVLTQILSHPWPYVSKEYCIYYRNMEQIENRPVVLLRITATTTDLTWLKQNYSKYYVGTYQDSTGTRPIIPLDYFDENWKFPVDEFLDLIKNIRNL